MRRRLIAATTAVMLAAAIVGASEPAPSVEYAVKAAFLLNFARLVEWPSGAEPVGAVSIAVLGADPFGASLEHAVGGKRVGRQLVRVSRAREAAEVASHTVLFVAASEMPEWARIRQELAGRPVLTVGDAPGFVERGGMIAFYLEENRVRFEVDPGALEANGLRLSSRVLALARIAGRRRGAAR